MKGAVFYGKHDLKIEELKVPHPKANEVIVKVMACGVCGTDVHIFNGDEGAAATPPGTVLGHEFAGVVTEIGKDVRNVKVGDRVCIDPNKICGNCHYCRNALGHFCERMIGIGTTVNGGFEQFCAIPESQIYKIADTTSFEEAAMAEPVSCCLHGIDMCNIKTNDTVLVIGCGMIGIIMIQLANAAGASRVIAIETDDDKFEKARKLGADLCINPIKEDVAQALKTNGITNVTKVIECVGKVQTMEQAICLAGKKATVLFFGLTAPDDTIKIKPFEIFKKELEIKASYINPYTQQRAIELIDSKRTDVKSMVCEIAPLSRLPEILSNPELRKKGKFIITPND